MSRGRNLSDGELVMCERVFASSLPRSLLTRQVMVWSSLGIGNRPFTARDFGLGRYDIFLGWQAFDETAVNSLDYKAVFIHEMTHVWQAENSWGIAAVWLSSIVCQCQRQGNAYQYGEGNLGKKSWDDFGKEEQAQIVQDWFSNGLSVSDKRFPYIRDNIRKGKAGFYSLKEPRSAAAAAAGAAASG